MYRKKLKIKSVNLEKIIKQKISVKIVMIFLNQLPFYGSNGEVSFIDKKYLIKRVLK